MKIIKFKILKIFSLVMLMLLFSLNNVKAVDGILLKDASSIIGGNFETVKDGTTADSNYSFSFQLTDKTSVEFWGYNGKVLSTIRSYDKRIAIMPTDNNLSGKIGCYLYNVGTYNGEIVNVKCTFDWEDVVDNNGKRAYPVIMACLQTNLRVVGFGFPTIGYGVKYELLDANMNPINISMSLSLGDIDATQYFGFKVNSGTVNKIQARDDSIVYYKNQNGYDWFFADDTMSSNGPESAARIELSNTNSFYVWYGSDTDKYSKSYFKGFRKNYPDSDLERNVNQARDMFNRGDIADITNGWGFFNGQAFGPYDVPTPTKNATDSNETGSTNNSISKDEVFYYDIYQFVPLESSTYYYSKFTLTDILPDNIIYMSSRIYDNSGKDVTNKFTITANGKTITAVANNTADSTFYSNTYKWRINAKFDKNILGSGVTSGNGWYYDSARICYVMSNNAKASIVRSGKTTEKTSNTTTTNYNKIPLKVEAKYIDIYTNEEVEAPVVINSYEYEPYSTEQKEVLGYKFVEVDNPTSGNLGETSITITYKYVKQSNVTVYHVDENTGEILKTDTPVVYDEKTNYTTVSSDIDGFTLTNNSGNTTGVMGRENIDVTYYYKRNTSVETRFIDQVTGQEIATIENQEGLENDDYTTASKVIDGYELVLTPTNATGKMAATKIIVTYEYRKNSNVIVEYIDENYNTNIIPNVVTKYKEGDVYTTEEKVFPGYQLTGKTTNTSGTVGNTDITVTYKYKKISAGVEIRYIDQVTGDIIADTIVKTGLEKAPYTSVSKDVSGYELVLTPANANGEMAVEKTVVTYEYRKNSYVTVKYIDENNGQTLFGPVNTKYKEGDIYTTVQEDISGYTFTRVDGEKTAEVGRENIVVTYYYKKNTSITVRYVDMLDKNAEISPAVVIRGLENDDYETEQKDIEGYIFVETSGLVNGKMKSEPTEVIYKYKKASKLITKHVDENSGEKIVADVEIIYKEGDTYEALAQSIPGYVLVREPDERTGVMGRENVTKTFYYKKLSGGLVVKYVDRLSGELLDQEIYEGNEADKIILDEKSFLGYVLDERPEFDEVILGVKPQEVIFYYKKTVTIDIIGIDQETGEEIYKTQTSGVEGDTYTTIARIVDGYELVRTPDNANGTFTREDTKVIYEYRKVAGKVTVKYIDKETNEELDNCTITGKVGDNYQTERKTFEDYEFVEVVGEEVGILAREEKEVVYYYVKKTGKLVVRYIDTEGNELLREESEAKVGELYKVEEKEIKGYEVIQRPENLEGKYEEGSIELVFVLEKISVKPIEKGTIIVKFVDEEGNSLLEDYVEKNEVGKRLYFETPNIEGYEKIKDEPVQATFVNGEIVFVVEYKRIENKIEELPETGDIAVVAFVIGAIVCIVGIAFVVVKNKTVCIVKK